MYFWWLVGHIIPFCIKAMIHLLGIALGLWDFQMQLCSFADVAHCKLLDNEDLDLGEGVKGEDCIPYFIFLIL